MTVEGSEGSRQQRNEQESDQVLSRVQRNERTRRKQQRLGRDALEIGAVLLPARHHEIQVGIDSCAAATVFAHFRWFVTKSCKSCVDQSARKVKGKLRGVQTRSTRGA